MHNSKITKPEGAGCILRCHPFLIITASTSMLCLGGTVLGVNVLGGISVVHSINFSTHFLVHFNYVSIHYHRHAMKNPQN